MPRPLPQDMSFETLAEAVRACRHCAADLPHEPKPVFRGQPSAKLMIVGQAPGTRVHASGVPFNDPSGIRLRSWLGMTPEEFYDEARVAILPMGFCFPGLSDKGADLPPRRICAPTWRDRLDPHFAGVKLKILVGIYSQRWHLGARACDSLTETVAHWRDYEPGFIPLPHPSWRNNAWLKRNPWFERELLPVLRHRVREVLA